MSAEAEIEERAAQWILRCDRGEEMAHEWAMFESWLAADARHRAAYLRLERVWQQSEGLKVWKPHDGALDPSVLQHAVVPEGKPARALLRRPFSLAAMFALVATGAMLWLALRATEVATYATETGGYQRIVLADGTAVQLNTDSRIAVHLSAQRREVRLLRGEAYFDIAHDARRPFDVMAAGTVVRALGTAFSVRLRVPGYVEVLVREGRVALADRALSAGEAALAEPNGLTVHRLDDPELARRLAWQGGQLAFQGKALAAVVAEFNRYNRRQVAIADRALESLEVGGTFKATDLESFIAAVRKALDVRVEETPEVVRLYAR